MSSYHMIEYIHESPAALRRTLSENEAAVQSVVGQVRRDKLERIVVVGIGSSYTAAMIAAPVFRYHCALPVHILPATELWHYNRRLVDERTLVVVVSRSGERGWVVEALKDSIGRGAFGIAMTGVADSLLAQNARQVLLTQEGPEITFPKTKSVTSCAGLLMRLALALSPPGDEEATGRLEALLASPGGIKRVIDSLEPSIRELVPKIRDQEPVVVIGTGSNYGVALEMAVKLQETACVATQCDDTGNLLHGPLGAMTDRWLLISQVTAYDLAFNKQLLEVAGKFGARRLCIIEPGLELNGLTDEALTLPDRVDPLLAGLMYLPVLQMLTYYWALARDLNPDAPAAMRAILDAILPEGREEPELRQ